ncbi:hypothetical protein RHSIM_Rhsim03G0037900 [Rhododendron simsii]|uniref:Uncharacterized protein n=1 Tax=Rhododendron simsii TaxID=118357 RepID=A0A834H4V0_RHOSS|nr:hypothetical protein RHSIM_Rhsim03G0037900 [Rhododendron simsii]
MSRFFSSFVGINSAMTIVKIILLLGLLPLSFTSSLDEAIGHLCHPDPTKTDEFPGVIWFPIPHDSDSIPPEFRALVGTEFAHPEDHLYPTVRFCRVSILVINRTSPFWPFQDLPVHNEVHQFQGYLFQQNNFLITLFHKFRHICVGKEFRQRKTLRRHVVGVAMSAIVSADANRLCWQKGMDLATQVDVGESAFNLG